MMDCSPTVKLEDDLLVDDDGWTCLENKTFEVVLSRFYNEADRFEKISAELSSRSLSEIADRFRKLQEDIELIEAGVYQPPDWQDSTESKRAKDSACLERRKGIPWTEEEHQLFLLGLGKFGKGDWRSISRNFVVSRTPTQVASHAQKYFIRLNSLKKKEKKPPNLEGALLKSQELLSKSLINSTTSADLLAQLPIASHAFTSVSMPLPGAGGLPTDAGATAMSLSTIPSQFGSVGLLGSGSGPPPLTIPQFAAANVDDPSRFSVDSIGAVSSMSLPSPDVTQNSPHLQTLTRQLSAAQLSGSQLSAMHLANGNVAAVAAAAAAAAQRFGNPQLPLLSIFGGIPNAGLHNLPVQGFMSVSGGSHPRPHMGVMSPHSSNANAAYMNM